MLIKQVLAAPINNPSSFNTLGDLVAALLPAVYGLGGLVLFLYLIFGGFKYLTAGGDDKEIQSAKKTLTNAVIGMLILFSSFWIMRMFEAILHMDILG